MSRVADAAKRQRFEAAYAAMRERMPLATRMQILEELHRISGVPVSTIRYYLKPKEDLRRRYSQEDVARLRYAHREILEAEAVRRGVTFSALQAAITRNATGQRTLAMLEEQGFLDFEHRGDRHAVGANKRRLDAARKVLKTFGLDARGPNLLVQEARGRCIRLRLGEQVGLLHNPRRFLRDCAGDLMGRWEPLEVAK